MATPAQRTNTWILNEWYDQAVAGTQGDYSGPQELWAWGGNENGKLGDNSKTDRSSPVQIPGTWTDMYGVGSSSAGCIRSDGYLFTWGYNGYGEGMTGNNTQYSSPKLVGGDSTWATYGKGGEFAIATKTDGTMWSAGRAFYGQLGLNQNGSIYYNSPAQIPGTNWSTTQAACCSNIAAFQLQQDGTLWAWGWNNGGFLAQNQSGPSPVDYSKSVPTQIGTETNWLKLANGTAYMSGTMGAIKTDGTLWMWGYGTSGQLGQNESGNPTQVYAMSSPVQIPGTTWKSCYITSWAGATKTDGTLWTWGNGSTGRSGLNSQTQYSSPVQIPGTNWDEVSGGEQSGFATKTDGTCWAWGRNSPAGQLGLNDNVNISSPTQLPGVWASRPPLGGHSPTANKGALGNKIA